jgi:general secretion pathway protein D
MMQDSKTTTDSKIPVLGDIPGLGLLFHHKVKSVNKTELLIFLTPYVIRTPEDLVRMTLDEKARMESAPKAFPSREFHDFLAPQPAAPASAPVPVAPAGSPHIR